LFGKGRLKSENNDFFSSANDRFTALLAIIEYKVIVLKQK
jgi:hypothetical protein